MSDEKNQPILDSNSLLYNEDTAIGITMMVLIDIQLSEELAEKARAAGLLTSDKIAELIESELERQRQAAADRLLTIMDELQEAARRVRRDDRR